MRRLLLLFLCVILWDCKTNERETPDGIKFTVVKQGDGIRPIPRQMVIFHYQLVGPNDSVWNDSYRTGLPAAALINDSSRIDEEKPIKQVFRMASVGDSLIMNFKASEYYRFVREPMPSTIHPSTPVSYRIKIERIMAAEGFLPWMNMLLTRQKNRAMQEDTKTIETFLVSRNVPFQKNQSGLYYTLLNNSADKKAVSGQTVTYNYSAYFLDGTCKRTTIRSVAEKENCFNPDSTYIPVKTVVDESTSMVGLNEAFKLLGKGDSGTFYLPRPLTITGEEVPSVANKKILIYRLEVLDVK
jgi:FKBP-type peptidyl-prolyl cis-trans isomerase FkpA